MDAHQRGVLLFRFAVDERHVVLAGQLVDIEVQLEVAVVRGQVHDAVAPHDPFARAAPGDERGDRQDAQAVLVRERDQVRQAGHLAVVAHDLADDGDGLEAGKPRQVDGGLGVAGAAQDAAGDGLQREHVAGADEVARRRLVVGQQLHGAGAVEGADAGGDAFAGVHGDGEGGAVAVALVQRHHAAETEPAEPAFFHRHADQAAAVGGHEVDDLGRGLFAGGDEVAFVFAVLVVHHQQHLAGADDVERLFHGAEHGLWSGFRHNKKPKTFLSSGR